MLIILTGKSASGKDTIKDLVLAKFPNIKKIITTTSRPLRTREINGVDYRFVTRDEFEAKIKNSDLAEYVEYGGNLYGTEKSELEQALNQDTLWKIDPSRAGEVRDFIRRAFPPEIANKLIERVVVIYITVSDDISLERLQKRGLLDSETEKRIDDDKKIWQQHQNSYDYVLNNIPGKLDDTIKEVSRIIETKNPK